MTEHIDRPSSSEFAPFYADYVALVTETNIFDALTLQPDELKRLAESIKAEKELYKYGPDKWTVRQVFGHLIDAERVFGYRAFCISRGERASLLAFDENSYVEQSTSNSISLRDHVAEFCLVRESNLTVLTRLTPDEFRRSGTANSNPITVRALSFIMVGHVRHHLKVLKERYGVE